MPYWGAVLNNERSISLMMSMLLRSVRGGIAFFSFRKACRVLVWVAPLLLMIAGCVPLKEMERVQGKADSLERALTQCGLLTDSLQLQDAEHRDQLARARGQIATLSDDTLRLRVEQARCVEDKARLQRDLSALEALQESLVASTQRETTKLLEEIQRNQEELRKREDALKELERSSYQRKQALDRLQLQLQRDSMVSDSLRRAQRALGEALAQRDADMTALRQRINQQDSATQALRQRVASALFGFEGKGLTVTLRNGRVLVSLDEQLMFKSGSYTVDPRGQEALRTLVPVLEAQTDFHIVVEGHTDNVPMRAAGPISDNWDLSVKRATSIVRVLLEGSKIDPARISASGRAEFAPLVEGNTARAREQNRRTEIILTPSMDTILEALGENDPRTAVPSTK